MALERLTKDNFVDHPPFFPVYDYWYNELVDAFNAIVPTAGTAQADTIDESTADAGVTIDGVLLKDSVVTTSAVLRSTALGTAAANVTTLEYSDGRHVTTTLSFSGLVLGAPTAGGASAHGVLLHTLSTTAITHIVKLISVQLGLTIGTVTTDTPDVGLGTVIASGAVATLDTTGTFEDLITGQTWNVGLDGTADDYFAYLPTCGISTEATVLPIINASGSATPIYLNVADTWDAGVTGNLTASGIVIIEYIIMTP